MLTMATSRMQVKAAAESSIIFVRSVRPLPPSRDVGVFTVLTPCET